MMFYITSYELAKALTEERTSRTKAEYRRRMATVEAPSRTIDREAEVVELTFGSHCDEDKIGA